MDKRKRNGFTLIELLIVVAIIGIVAAIAVPNLLIAYQKGRQKGTMGDMRNLGVAIESYATDLTYVPQVASGPVSSLRPILVNFYIPIFPDRDGWGVIMQWEYAVNFTDNYSIVSWGRDKGPGGPAGAPTAGVQYPLTRLGDFDNDIVYSSGTFTFGPRR